MRSFPPDVFRLLCEELASSGNLEWLDKTKRRALVFWRSPAQIGMEIYRYPGFKQCWGSVAFCADPDPRIRTSD
jgi:hypothetical protein